MLSCRKFILSALAIVFFCTIALGKEKQVPTIIKSWNLRGNMCLVDTIEVDTSYINYPLRNAVNDYSIASAYSGNLVSPIEAKVYFDREDKVDFLFARAYSPYIISPQDVHFYNTTTPYSRIGYKRSFKSYHVENDLSFAFTGNVSKRTNLGVNIDYLNAVGRYQSQSGKVVNGAVFGSYNGTHYGCHGAITFSVLSNFENGGLTTPDSVGGIIKEEELPVNLNAMSGYKYVSGFWNHHYSICVERDKKIANDSIVTEYIPVTTFMHTFECSQSTKRYLEKAVNSTFYEQTLLNPIQTKDTANVLTIRNTLAVTFEEEFNRILKFGAMVYAVNECKRYGYSTSPNTPLMENTWNNQFQNFTSHTISYIADSLIGHHWTNNTFVGGALYKNRGRYIHYGFDGDICLVGYKQWEFKVNGHVDGNFRIGKDTMRIAAIAYVRNETPDYFLQHYRSNHFVWNNNFEKTYRFMVGGNVAYPTKWIKPSVDIRFENLTRHIYFGEDGLPKQHDGNIQVLATNVHLDITTPWINLENNVVYQMSSDSCLPLPTVTLYHNLYYHGCWFKALEAQIGIDLHYHTAYYAPLLCPATGQFCVQNKEKIGNYPVVNIYANFYAKPLHLRFFFEVSHFNQFFAKKKTYFTMPGYALNPTEFRAGLSWHFYR